MLEPSSTDILDAAFASRDTAVQLQILRIIHSFLASQDRSPATVQGINGRSKQGGEAVQMDELVGNVEGFADSGYVHSSQLTNYPTRTQFECIGDSAASRAVSPNDTSIELSKLSSRLHLRFNESVST